MRKNKCKWTAVCIRFVFDTENIEKGTETEKAEKLGLSLCGDHPVPYISIV